MGTSAIARVSWPRTGSDAVLAAAYGLGAVALAGEAAAHVQQYATVVHGVRWIGPLFLVNAVASVVAIAGLTYERTRQLAALAGIVISVLALGALVVSYGNGLFGYHEGGFRTGIALAVIAEVAAVVLLAGALAARNALPHRR